MTLYMQIWNMSIALHFLHSLAQQQRTDEYAAHNHDLLQSVDESILGMVSVEALTRLGH